MKGDASSQENDPFTDEQIDSCNVTEQSVDGDEVQQTVSVTEQTHGTRSITDISAD